MGREGREHLKWMYKKSDTIHPLDHSHPFMISLLPLSQHGTSSIVTTLCPYFLPGGKYKLQYFGVVASYILWGKKERKTNYSPKFCSYPDVFFNKYFFNSVTWCSWFLWLFINPWLIWIACLVPWSRLFSQGVWVLGCFVLTQLWLLQLTGYCNHWVLKHLRCPGFQVCGFLPHCLADTSAHLGSQGQWSLSAWPLHFPPNSMEWKIHSDKR